MRRTSGTRLFRFIPALAIGAGTLVALAPGASAGTTTTFSLTAGSLTINQPSTASIGSAAVGSLTLQGPLGAVSVTDQRGQLVATWTATVSSTSFTTGGASTNETVPTSSIAYASGVATATSGTGAFTPGVLANLSTPGTAGSWTGGVGNNSASWNPTITFTLSPSQVAGTYTGTITHSVA